MSVAAWAAVASSIVAAVSHCVAAGSFLVAWKAWRRDELAVRRDVLRRLVGNAYRLTQRWQGQEGEPFIVYTDFPRVTSALENMHNELDRDGRLSPNLVTVADIAHGAAGADQPLHLQVQILVLRLSHRDPGVTVERHPAAPLAGMGKSIPSCQGEINRVFQPPPELRQGGIPSRGRKQGCFQPGAR